MSKRIGLSIVVSLVALLGTTALADEVNPAEAAPADAVPSDVAPSDVVPAESAPEEASAAVIFQIDPESKVEFTAKITGSSFKGESRGLKGTAELDSTGKSLSKINILLPADSIKTGMAKRDSHMYEKYLKTDKHPLITFKADSVPFELAPGGKGVVAGTFSIHGVEKPVKIEFTVKSRGPNDFVLDSAFELDILDYGMKQPKFMVVKMNTVLKMELRLIMRKKA